MKTSDRFRDARERISDPTKWIKGSMAKDQHGRIPNRNEDAVCWCAYGSLYHSYLGLDKGVGVYDSSIWDSPIGLFDKAAKFVSGLEREDDLKFNDRLPLKLISFNDAQRTTHEEILAVFDRAIELAEEVENIHTGVQTTNGPSSV